MAVLSQECEARRREGANLMSASYKDGVEELQNN